MSLGHEPLFRTGTVIEAVIVCDKMPMLLYRD